MMILQAARSGGDLGATPVFKCTSTICYSTDGLGVNYGTDGLFRSLQTAINKHSQTVGFSPIGVDGKIGASTVAALAKILDRAKVDAPGSPFLTTLAIGATSKEAAARGVQAITGALGQFAFTQRVATTPPSGGGGGYVPPSPEMPLPGAGIVDDGSAGNSLTADATAHWPYYAAGGILAVAALFGAMTLASKKKKASPSTQDLIAKTKFKAKSAPKAKRSGAQGKMQRGLVPVSGAFVPNEASVRKVLAATLLRKQRPSAHQKHLLTAAYMHDVLPYEAGGVHVAQWVEDGFPIR